MTLTINIKKEWFDMIFSGEKKEEYRDIKYFWGIRFLDFKEETEYGIFDELLNEFKNIRPDSESIKDLLQHYDCDFKQFDKVLFINGMKTKEKSRRFEIELKGIDIDYGLKKWGAITERKYFVIKLGKISSSQNCT